MLRFVAVERRDDARALVRDRADDRLADARLADVREREAETRRVDDLALVARLQAARRARALDFADLRARARPRLTPQPTER